MQQKKTLTIAEYSRLRGLNKSTVSRQVREGKIPTVDGRIDPIAADQAREQNLNPARKAGAARRKAGKRNDTESNATPAENSPAVAHVVRRIISVDQQLAFGRACLAVGSTPEQAFAIGSWFGSAVAGAIPEVSVEDLEGCSDPSEAEWRRALGAIDFEEADSLYGLAGGTSDGQKVETAAARPKPETLLEAQTRKEIALANLREVEAALACGAAVSISDAMELVGRDYAACRSRLLAIPYAAAPEVAPITDPHEVETVLRKAIHEALRELSEAKHVIDEAVQIAQ